MAITPSTALVIRIPKGIFQY